METFDVSTTEASAIRELASEELVWVTGASTNSNSYSSSYQGGGADGYGGSRRNP
jgi:hypothetical protein